jgi:PAS domain S-box-containing protein
MSEGFRSAIASIAIAVLSAGVALLLRWPLWPLIQADFPYLTFFPAVLAAGYLGGRGAGLLTTGLGALAATFVLILPNRPATSDPSHYVGTLVVYLVAGGVMSLLAGMLHSARVGADDLAAQARRLWAELDALLTHAPIGFAFFDSNRRAVRVNPALAALRCVPPEKLAGQPIDAVLPPGPESAAALLERVFTTGLAVLEYEWKGRLFSGEERTWLVTVYPIRPPDPEQPSEVVGLIVADVSERHRLETELRRRIEELAESERRKDIFLAMVSHELRNPLATLRNATELMERGVGPSPKLVGMFARQLAQLTRLVDDLLDTARISRGQIDLRRQVVELGDVMDTAIEMVQAAIEQGGHALVVNQPDRPILIEADPARLAQVAANLLHNAARFTPRGGEVRLDVLIESDEMVMRVSDTGIGIRSEMLGRIFELFQQGDHPPSLAPGGLGLGLTLVRRLAELHGGSVTASSPGPGKGSTFEVRLPCLAAAAEPDHPPQTGPPTATGARRVLVVDDNEDAGQSLALLLECQGHEVRVVRDGETALEDVGQWRPDVIILDIGMPGMDGYEVVECLRKEYGREQLRVVALTGFGQEEDRRRGLEAGFDEFLVKPAGPDELIRAVSGV